MTKIILIILILNVLFYNCFSIITTSVSTQINTSNSYDLNKILANNESWQSLSEYTDTKRTGRLTPCYELIVEVNNINKIIITMVLYHVKERDQCMKKQKFMWEKCDNGSYISKRIDDDLCKEKLHITSQCKSYKANYGPNITYIDVIDTDMKNWMVLNNMMDEEFGLKIFVRKELNYDEKIMLLNSVKDKMSKQHYISNSRKKYRKSAFSDPMLENCFTWLKQCSGAQKYINNKQIIIIIIVFYNIMC